MVLSLVFPSSSSSSPRLVEDCRPLLLCKQYSRAVGSKDMVKGVARSKVDSWECLPRSNKNKTEQEFLESCSWRLSDLIDLSYPNKEQVSSISRSSSSARRRSPVQQQQHQKHNSSTLRNNSVGGCGGVVSSCGWFWGDSASMEEVHSRLSLCSVGTFLLRLSSHPQYKYSLSVSTPRGPTSVRVVCSSGESYSLDAADAALPLPRFPSVVALVQYYVEEFRRKKRPEEERLLSPRLTQVWVESGSGRTHSRVQLERPLLRTPPSLMHQARVALNRERVCLSRFSLPRSLGEYLKEYPYTI